MSKEILFERFGHAWKLSEDPVQVTEGYKFNYCETVNKIELYINSKFKSGDTDSEGNKKYFFNIGIPQAGNATKNIDLDTKDIQIKSYDGEDRYRSMILREEFLQWANKNRLGKLLNDVVEQLPRYGHIILRKHPDGKIKRVRLKDFRRDWGVDTLEESSFTIQKYYMQPHELLEMKEWDGEAIERVIDSYRKNKDSNICVYEVRMELPSEIFGAPRWGAFFVATNQDRYFTDKSYKGFQEVLYLKEIEWKNRFPYKEAKYFSIEGRGMGLGVIELGFDAQQRWNEMANQKAKSMQISSKHIFQTRDDSVQKNIMSDVLDGEIMRVKSEITPIANEERNLAAYSQEERNVIDVLRNLTNAQEVVTGETLPSGTPFRLGALLNQNASKLFEFIRENLGLFWEDVVRGWVLPSFRKESVMKHILEAKTPEVIDAILERDVNRRLNDAIKKYVIKNGAYPPQQIVDGMKAVMMNQRDKTEFVEIAEDWLKFDYDIQVVITDEKFNMQQRIETASNILQLLAQNPQVLMDKRVEGLLNRLMEDVGISPSLINKNAEVMQPTTAQLGQAPSAGNAVGQFGAGPFPG